MTEEGSYEGAPPFPDDVPTAPLLRLSLSELRRDAAESDRLFSACKDLGFFYLDLRDDVEGQALLTGSERLFDVSRALFDLGRDELQKYDYKPQGSYFGYKGFATAVIDASGTLDRNEFYNAGKDDFLNQSLDPFAHPSVLTDSPNDEILRSFMTTSHSVVSLLLAHLNEHLCLPASTLQDLHRQTLRSGDHIRFIKSPPQPLDNLGTSMGAHTDYGSLTLLFNRLGGLQVLPPNTDTWHYVRPLPGHVIVNLGDAMVKFTNGLLRSNIHRVVAPPGHQVGATRYSLVYFARPGDDVKLRRLEGSHVIPELEAGVEEEDVCSKDWIRDKAMAKRTGVYKGPESLNLNRETLRRELKT